MRFFKRMESPSDQSIEPYLRQHGRIQSLHEFQQRVDQGSKQQDSDITLSIHDDETESQGSGVRDSVLGQMRHSVHHGSEDNPWWKLRRRLRLLLLLLLIGGIAGPLNYALKSASSGWLAVRLRLASSSGSDGSGFLIWAGCSIVLLTIALLITRISPVAKGSGLPQMKIVLTGIDHGFYLPGFFKLKTLVAKIGGLVFAIGSGLVVGTEGAFVHMMGIISTHLMQLQIFQRFGHHRSSRLQILAAACAVGVSSNFSAPIGGVLFSIEVTSTYYMISNYWKAFVSSVCAATMVVVTSVVINGDANMLRGKEIAPFATDFSTTPFHFWEIPLYMVLGMVMGLVGALIVWLIKVIATFRKNPYSKHPVANKLLAWIDPIAVSLLTAALTWFPGEIMRNPIQEDVGDFFANDDLPSLWGATLPMEWSLFTYFAIHAFLLPLSISLKLPTGAWIPTFAAGAAFGRLCGELMNLISPGAVNPATYALVGAASLAGSVTQTVSAAVIALEVTGQLRLLIPVCIGVLFSISISSTLVSSVYETLMRIRGLPYTPSLDFATNGSVGDVMDRELVYVTKTTTVAKLLLAVNRLPGHDIPVVYNDETMLLQGTLHSNQLKKIIRMYYAVNNIADVALDIGDPVSQRPHGLGFSWNTLKTMIKSRTRSDVDNMEVSFDRLHALSFNRRVSSGTDEECPTQCDDIRMTELMMSNWSEEKRQLLTQDISLCFGDICRIKPMALTLSSETQLESAHVIFTMLRCDHCYIIDQGKLSGVLTTSQMLEANRKNV